MSITITWLGQSGFLIQTPHHGVVIDPFLTGNPTAPFGWQQLTAVTTHIALTHGHADHVGDALALSNAASAPMLAMVELCLHLQSQQTDAATEMLNLGGGLALGHGTTLTLVPAWHSTGAGQGAAYTGTAAGIVLQTPTHTVYHAGDTAMFTDMALIAEYYQPDVVILPIGGRFTMDAKAAAFAARKFFPHAKHIVPMHFATFPLLAPSADEFVQHAHGLPVQVLVPGQTWAVPLTTSLLSTPKTPGALSKDLADVDDVA